jgi:alpha-keto-acid decarboxylase
VVADTGTSFFGAATHRLPPEVTFLGQPLWASIGYSLPALLGACLADPGRRRVVLIGDGAAQMTIQELSTIQRLGLSAVVVLVDNGGYSVERAIQEPTQPYNEVARWDWTLLTEALWPERPTAPRRPPTSIPMSCTNGAGRSTFKADPGCQWGPFQSPVIST